MSQTNKLKFSIDRSANQLFYAAMILLFAALLSLDFFLGMPMTLGKMAGFMAFLGLGLFVLIHRRKVVLDRRLGKAYTRRALIFKRSINRRDLKQISLKSDYQKGLTDYTIWLEGEGHSMLLARTRNHTKADEQAREAATFLNLILVDHTERHPVTWDPGACEHSLI